MSEPRRNPLTGEWVIIAPERGRRPHQSDERDADGSGRSARAEPAGVPSRPAWDLSCPFCPGNEDMLPGITVQFSDRGIAGAPGEAGASCPDRAASQVRVIPNKFPALRPEEGGEAKGEGGGAPQIPTAPAGAGSVLSPETSLPGRGLHEVIVESPRHDRDLAAMTGDGVVTVLEAYRRRILAARTVPGVRRVVVFRNHGTRAGASLLHPHSQLVAVPVVPEETARRERESRAYHAATGRCLLCELAGRERTEGRRQVHGPADREGFDVMVPYAAGVPFEMWVVPRRHSPDFAAVPHGDLRRLASCLTRVHSALKAELDDPDHNYVLHTFGAEAADPAEGEPGQGDPGRKDPALHWLLQIRPRLVTPAGFEVGSGIPINPSLPEEDAARLRSRLSGS